MKTYFDWFEYNSKRNKEAIRIYNYNLKSKVNYIEKSFYKNVRDIYALSLLLAKRTNSISNVLDYGSNLIPHSNLLNKIVVSKYKFFIYNPLIKKINKRLKLKFEFVNKIKDLKKNRFDLVYFGSSLQYIQNLKEIGDLQFMKRSNYILITHTPISLNNSKNYRENQANENNLIQSIHSYREITKNLLRGCFNLKFKSVNEFKYSGLKKRKKKCTFIKFTF